MISNAKDRVEHTPLDGSAGVIYVAIGARFVAEARLSAESVRRVLPEVPILLFTDRFPESRSGFDEIIKLSTPHPKPHINKLIAMMRIAF